MRLVFILDETPFYQPGFLARFIDETKDDVVGIAIVKKVPPKSDLNRYLARHFYFLSPGEIYRLARAALIGMLRNKFDLFKRDGCFYSVESVAQHYNIDHFDVYNSINKKCYLKKLSDFKPDVIISSNSLIFGKKLLALPVRCCLNRHSSLLPSYGGLWPVFRAVLSGEKYVGVSIHTMEAAIDRGILLAQKEIEIGKGDSVADLYVKCFDHSVGVLLQALDKISRHDMSPVHNEYPLSYYSFPTAEDWKQFRKCKGRFF